MKMEKYEGVNEEKTIRFGVSVWVIIALLSLGLICSFLVVAVKVLQHIGIL